MSLAAVLVFSGASTLILSSLVELADVVELLVILLLLLLFSPLFSFVAGSLLFC